MDSFESDFFNKDGVIRSFITKNFLLFTSLFGFYHYIWLEKEFKQRLQANLESNLPKIPVTFQ